MKRRSTVKAERDPSTGRRIDAWIEALGDWRGETLARVRALITKADPGVVEEWKWVKPTSPGVPVWSHDGLVCTGEVYRDKVKLTFARGASLADPSGLFNASLEGSTRRAIDLHEGEGVDGKAFQALVRAAVALNTAGAGGGERAARGAGNAAGARRATSSKARAASRAKEPALRAGSRPR